MAGADEGAGGVTGEWLESKDGRGRHRFGLLFSSSTEVKKFVSTGDLYCNGSCGNMKAVQTRKGRQKAYNLNGFSK